MNTSGVTGLGCEGRAGVLGLAVVIVNYNTSDDLERCLDSIFANPPSCSFQVTVVDNASSDQALTAVRDRFRGVDWLLNSQNTGYARGCNQGMAAHPAEFYLILNPDIVVQPGAMDRLLAFAATHPRAGIVGPQLLNEDGSIQDSCRRFYTLGTLLMRRTFLGRLFPRSRIVHRHLMRDFDHLSSRPVDWILGGCMLVSNDALARTGPMDERFFLYFEDVDWCFRMWQAGCEVQYTPEARFQHRHRRASTAGAFHRSFWLHLGSLISFYEKWGLLVWLVKRWRDPLLVMLFWLLDMIAVGTGFALAYGLRSWGGSLFPQELFSFGEYMPLLIYTLLLSTVVFIGGGRYAPGCLRRRAAGVRDLQQVGIIFMLLLASTYLGHMEVISRAVLLIYLPLLATAVVTTRGFLRGVLHRLEKGRLALERTLLAGPRHLVADWLAAAGELAYAGVDLVGYICPHDEAGVLPPLAAGRVPWLGRPDDLVVVAGRFRVSQVVFWPTGEIDSRTLRLWGTLRRMGLHLRWQTRDAWLLATGARVEILGGSLGAVRGTDQAGLWHRAGRRVMSLAGGLMLALISGPVRLGDRLGRRVGRRIMLRRVRLLDPWGFDPELEVAVSGSGDVLPLSRQWGMARGLLSDKITLAGPWTLADGLNWREPAPEGMLAFWDSEPAPGALLGTGWDKREQGSFWARMHHYWLHPGNLLNLESPVGDGSCGDDPA